MMGISVAVLLMLTLFSGYVVQARPVVGEADTELQVSPNFFWAMADYFAWISFEFPFQSNGMIQDILLRELLKESMESEVQNNAELQVFHGITVTLLL